MGIGRVGVGWVSEILFAAISLEKIACSKCLIQITKRCRLLTEYLNTLTSCHVSELNSHKHCFVNICLFDFIDFLFIHPKLVCKLFLLAVSYMKL